MPGKRTESMLTTIDNPFDPFTEFPQWNTWDMQKGYNTLNLLARVALVSPEFSEADQALAEEDAIDEIVFYNVSGVHRKVVKEYSD